MGYVLGLDVGTSFTAAVVRSDGASRSITLGNRSGAVPTAAYVREDGSLFFGEEAVLAGRSQPSRLVLDLKRRLGSGKPLTVAGHRVEPIDLVAEFVAWAVGRVTEREGGEPTRAVLTHPATWGSMRRADFAKATEKAGLAEVSLAIEPVAAAIFHSTEHTFGDGAPIAVYDLGGGTFDAAALRWSPFGIELCGPPQGIDQLGGLEFDEALATIVRRHLGNELAEVQASGTQSADIALANMANECVQAKEALSSESEVDIPVLLPGVSRVLRVRRDEFELLIRPSIEDTVQVLRQALDVARVRPGDLAAVLLVGGASRTPLVIRLVTELVGADVPILRAEPKLAVAKGAAILAESM